MFGIYVLLTNTFFISVGHSFGEYEYLFVSLQSLSHSRRRSEGFLLVYVRRSVGRVLSIIRKFFIAFFFHKHETGIVEIVNFDIGPTISIVFTVGNFFLF